MDYERALELARAALMGHLGRADEAAEAVASLGLLGNRVQREASISTALKIEVDPLARSKDDKGLLVEYMGVQVIIATRREHARDKGVMVLLKANTPRLVDVTLEDWEPDMVVIPASDLDLIDLDDEGAPVDTGAPEFLADAIEERE